MTTRTTSPLTLTIAGNVKGVVTIVLSVVTSRLTQRCRLASLLLTCPSRVSCDFFFFGKTWWCRGLLGGSAPQTPRPPGPPVSAQHWVEFLEHFSFSAKFRPASGDPSLGFGLPFWAPGDVVTARGLAKRKKPKNFERRARNMFLLPSL